MMKKFTLFLMLVLLSFSSFADGGMWLPIFLKYNEAEMKELGFRLTAEDVYSVNNHSMKDAVMLFGSGCTGELISKNGLVLTNHHCGYSYIQRLSSLEHNYLHNGFWASSYQEELPCPGLTVTFLKYMVDVTDRVLEGAENLTGAQREAVVEKNKKAIVAKEMEGKGNDWNAYIKSFYYGNQYFMFVNQVFSDVRLVGTPPENIGKFGGDTDNWVWPRHTGDFSLYRIYTDADGNPAPYSPNNIPMKPVKYFPIALDGLDENDFTMVVGYPGTTMQYLISDGVDLVVNYRNPAAIQQRGTRLDIMKKYMNESTEIRLMYSAKSNSISNGWKKWIGENKGILETGVIADKVNQEIDFQKKVNADPKLREKYGNVIQTIKDDYNVYKKLEKKSVFLRETFLAVELPMFAEKCAQLLQNNSNVSIDSLKKILYKQAKFYDSYYEPIDKEIFAEILHYYFNNLETELMPQALQKYANAPKSDFEAMAENYYDNSVFADKETFLKFIDALSAKSIKKFNDWYAKNQIFAEARAEYVRLNMEVDETTIPYIKSQLNEHYRIYLEALKVVDAQRVQFPDANLTMRVTYGQMKGLSTVDGIMYLPYTTAEGILQKENPDVFDYKVDAKLKTLIQNKDFGRYADKNGDLRVAFIASNQTTGGNSGSPVINGDGYLVGVNFDRIWEGTMSDIRFNLSRCRNISLDIRYFLFIVDKYANAQNIISELDIR